LVSLQSSLSISVGWCSHDPVDFFGETLNVLLDGWYQVHCCMVIVGVAMVS